MTVFWLLLRFQSCSHQTSFLQQIFNVFFKNIHICPWYIFYFKTQGRPFAMAIYNHNWMRLLLLMQRLNSVVLGSNRKMIAVIIWENYIKRQFLLKKTHKWKYNLIMHKIFEKASEIEIEMSINKILAFTLFQLFCHLVIRHSSIFKCL